MPTPARVQEKKGSIPDEAGHAEELVDLAKAHDIYRASPGRKSLSSTQSILGLLQDWDAARARFSKVTPRAYAKVMEVRRQAENEGLDLDSDEVWARIMEASNG